jgi:hypothetical protein
MQGGKLLIAVSGKIEGLDGQCKSEQSNLKLQPVWIDHAERLKAEDI